MVASMVQVLMQSRRKNLLHAELLEHRLVDLPEPERAAEDRQREFQPVDRVVADRKSAEGGTPAGTRLSIIPRPFGSQRL